MWRGHDVFNSSGDLCSSLDHLVQAQVRTERADNQTFQQLFQKC